MSDFEEQIRLIIEQITEFFDRGERFRNTDLTKIYRDSGQDLFSPERETHLLHELCETALNIHVIKNIGQEKFRDNKSHAQILNDLIDLLEKCPPQSWRGKEQLNLHQFSTPPTIAFLMAVLLNPQEPELTLEPSAGTGSLAIWIKIAGCRIHLNELSEKRRILLGIQGFTPTHYNAEFLDDLLPDEIRPDAILMNPPFSSSAGRTKSGNSNFGFRHITSALQRLKKGGRLIGLFGTDALTKTQKGKQFLSNISISSSIKAIIHLPNSAYYKYGTNLPVSILCIVKNEKRKSMNEWLKFNCSDLEDILSHPEILNWSEE